MSTNTNEPSKKTISVASAIHFNMLAKHLESLSKINSSVGKGKEDVKKKELQLFIKTWNDKAAELKKVYNEANTTVSSNFFPALRLLLPSEDRRVYGLKESKLAVFIIKGLGLSDKSDDAIKLTNFASYHADLASAAFDVLIKRISNKDGDKQFTIEEINKHLDVICANNAKGICFFFFLNF
jgi:hypothetical protein